MDEEKRKKRLEELVLKFGTFFLDTINKKCDSLKITANQMGNENRFLTTFIAKPYDARDMNDLAIFEEIISKRNIDKVISIFKPKGYKIKVMIYYSSAENLEKYKYTKLTNINILN